MLHAAVGLASVTLLAATLVLSACFACRWPRVVRWALLALVLIAACLPYEGVAGAEYFRALVGDLSMPTLIMLTLATYTQMTGRAPIRAQSATIPFILALGAGVFLYPLELGLTHYSPYSLGYGSNLFFGALFLIALAAWWRGEFLTVCCITLGCGAYLVGLLESSNLWDYLIDPVIVLFAPIWLVVRAFQRWRSKHRATQNAAIALPVSECVTTSKTDRESPPFPAPVSLHPLPPDPAGARPVPR